MNDFVIRESEYPRLPQLLLDEAPGFGASEEYARLHPDDRDNSSVVCGAFMQYVERLHTASGVPTATIAETYRAMERLATSYDQEVANALVVDVFEHLDLPDAMLDEFRSRLGAASRALYDRWIDPTDPPG